MTVVSTQTFTNAERSAAVDDIEQALAEALHECKAVGGPWMPCDARGECDCWSMSKHILTTKPMRAITRRVALADQLAEALRHERGANGITEIGLQAIAAYDAGEDDD